MQTPSRVRSFKPAADKAKIVAAYLHSDLTQEEFAAQQGIGGGFDVTLHAVPGEGYLDKQRSQSQAYHHDRGG